MGFLWYPTSYSFDLSVYISGLFSDIGSDIFLVLFLAAQLAPSTEIDSGISQAIRNLNKIFMSKNIFSDKGLR